MLKHPDPPNHRTVFGHALTLGSTWIVPIEIIDEPIGLRFCGIQTKNFRSLQSAFRDFLLVPAEVVAEFMQESGANFVTIVVLLLAHPFPKIG
jgi:hypothetical protein